MTFSLGMFSQLPLVASLLIALVIGCVLLTGYLAYQRLIQRKLTLLAVLVANTVAGLTVLGLAFEIQIMTTPPSEVYLITKGASDQQLTQIDPEQSVFIMSRAVKSNDKRYLVNLAKVIDIPAQILSSQSSFKKLHVIGDGLSLSQWQTLQLLMGETYNDISVTFSASSTSFASTPNFGLTDMSWQRELAVGQYVEVNGRLQGRSKNAVDPLLSNKIYQLNLLDPVGQVVESIRLKAQESFTFSFPAKSIGQWQYRLQLSQANQSQLISEQTIAFSVVSPEPLKILIKQSAPSFETRQIKNWAAQFTSQITVLTQISQDKDIRQNINLDAQQQTKTAATFTQQALAQFDWLLIDGRALLALNTEQMTALKAAIENGLGMYVIADNELIQAWPTPELNWLTGINIQPLDVANYSAIPNWPNSKIDQPIGLLKARLSAKGNASLVQSNQGEILVTSSQIGFGKVAVSLIKTTYGWQTSGMTTQYSHFWQSILYALARPKQTPYWLDIPRDELHLTNQPLTKCLLATSNVSVVDENHRAEPFTLTEDFIQPEKQCVTVWPINVGWQKLTMLKESESSRTPERINSALVSWFYAYGENDWATWQQTNKHNVSRNSVQQSATTHVVARVAKPLEKIWLWGLLVLVMSLLWLERKLD